MNRAPDHVVHEICSRAVWCRQEVVDAVLTLALEIAHEGRPVGALFTLGRSAEVLECSRPLILDPVAGHAPGATHVTDPRMRGTVRELAQLDGAFVLSEDGTVVASCRYLDVSTDGVDLAFGLGTRHLAAASVSKKLRVITVAVSESGGVRVYYDGEQLAEL